MTCQREIPLCDVRCLHARPVAGRRREPSSDPQERCWSGTGAFHYARFSLGQPSRTLLSMVGALALAQLGAEDERVGTVTLFGGFVLCRDNFRATALPRQVVASPAGGAGGGAELARRPLTL